MHLSAQCAFSLDEAGGLFFLSMAVQLFNT